MRIQWKWVNGLVFGLSHVEYLDFDEAEGETLEEKLASAPRVPMVFLHLGPIQLIFVW